MRRNRYIRKIGMNLKSAVCRAQVHIIRNKVRDKFHDVADLSGEHNAYRGQYHCVCWLHAETLTNSLHSSQRSGRLCHDEGCYQSRHCQYTYRLLPGALTAGEPPPRRGRRCHDVGCCQAHWPESFCEGQWHDVLVSRLLPRSTDLRVSEKDTGMMQAAAQNHWPESLCEGHLCRLQSRSTDLRVSAKDTGVM
jgi:hypothetical protein